MGKDYEVEDASKRAEDVDLIDTLVNETSSAIHTDRTIGGLSYKDKELLQLAPVPWRDPVTVEGVAKLMRTYRDELAVPLKDVLSIGGLWDHFEDMSSLMQTSRGDHSMDMSEDALIKLESLHKITIVYLWLSYRNPVAFSQRDEAVRIKERLEKVMEWTLQRITTRDDKRPANRREPLKFGPGENVKKSFDPRTGSNERRPFNKKSWTETSERKPSKFIKEESKVSNSFKGTLKLKHTPPSTSS